MSFSQGNIMFVNNPAAVPSVPVTSLINGLHLTGTIGKMGGDLLENTSIPLKTFTFDFYNNIGNNAMHLDGVNDFYSFGASTKSKIVLTGNVDIALFIDNGRWLELNRGNSTYQIGDLNQVDAGVVLSVENKLVKVKDNLLNNYLLINTVGNINQFGGILDGQMSFATDADKGNMNYENGGNPFRWLRIEGVGKFAQMGDIDSMANNTFLMVHDPAQVLDLYSKVGGIAGRFLHISPGTAQYIMGDFDQVHLGGIIMLDDSASVVTLRPKSGTNFVITEKQGFPGSGETAISTNSSDFWTFDHEIAGAVSLVTSAYLQVWINTVPYKIALVN